jgi:hypothetical protein
VSSTYQQVYDYAKAHGVEVIERLPRGPLDPLGYYQPALLRKNGNILAGPRIRMFVSDPASPPAEATDTITLAHEFGHHRRHEKRANDPEYQRYRRFLEKEGRDPATWPASPLEDRQRVLAEEEGAWDEAEPVLRALNFSEWAAFEADRKAALADYRKRLDLSAGSDPSAVPLGRMDPNPPTDRALEAFKVQAPLQHASDLEQWKTVIESGLTALKSLILINGGAAVALLAFLGNLLTKAPPTGRGYPTEQIALSMLMFVLGVFLAGFGTAARFMIFLAMSRKRAKLSNFFNALAIASGMLSLAAFVVGGWMAYKALR